MIKFNQISNIGIGTYRMNLQNSRHREALEYAIQEGINLIDTSSNYSDGDSETLVSHLDINLRKDVFVVTKAGYISGGNFKFFNKASSTKNLDYIKLRDSLYYSIDPLYLDVQIKESLRRMDSDYLDAFLLHNPEYLLRKDFSQENIDKVQKKIMNALHFLEGLKNQGLIRYYGISSNILAGTIKGINLKEIIEQTKENNFSGFKLVQFPFNLIENSANNHLFGDRSLIQFCKDEGLHICSNRPLNTQVNGHFTRLVDFNNAVSEEGQKLLNDTTLVNRFVDIIKEKMIELEVKEDISNFTPLKLLIDHGRHFGNEESVYSFYQNQLSPFLYKLYNAEIPNSLAEIVDSLHKQSLLGAKELLRRRSQKLKVELYNKAIIKDREQSFAISSVKYCQDCGIDTVLIGMRKQKYVDEFLSILN